MDFVDNENLWNEDLEKKNSTGYFQLLYLQMENNLKHGTLYKKLL